MTEDISETEEAIGPKIMRYVKVTIVVILVSVILYYVLKGWGVTCINVWDNTALPFRLPTMIIAAFLVGFVPMYVWHELMEWRWENKMAKLQKSVSKIAPPAG